MIMESRAESTALGTTIILRTVSVKGKEVDVITGHHCTPAHIDDSIFEVNFQRYISLKAPIDG